MNIIAGHLAAPCSNQYRMAIAIYLKLEKVPFASLGKMARSHEHLIIFLLPSPPVYPIPFRNRLWWVCSGALRMWTWSKWYLTSILVPCSRIIPQHACGLKQVVRASDQLRCLVPHSLFSHVFSNGSAAHQARRRAVPTKQ